MARIFAVASVLLQLPSLVFNVSGVPLLIVVELPSSAINGLLEILALPVKKKVEIKLLVFV